MKRLSSMLCSAARRVRGMQGNAALSLQYMRKLRRTPAEESAGLTRLRPWKLPICWIRGHVYGRRGSVEISCYYLEFCRCCGEEIIGRTRWDDIEPRPADEDLPWDFYDDEADD